MGSTGRIDYQTGDLWLSLKTAVPTNDSAKASYARQAAITLDDQITPGLLSGPFAGSGTVDYVSGVIAIRPLTPLPKGSLAQLNYASSPAEEPKVVPPIDGVTRGFTMTLANMPVSRGALEVGPDAEPLTPDLPFDGARKDLSFSAMNALKAKPILPGSINIQIGATTLSDSQRDGILIALDGSTGTVDYGSGAINVSAATAPASETRASANYSKQEGPLTLTPNMKPDGIRKNFEFSAANAVDKRPIVAGSATLSVSEGLQPQTAFDGSNRRNSFLLAKLPVQPGSVKLNIGNRAFSDGMMMGQLQATDGSTGTIEYGSGAINVWFSSAPTSADKADAEYGIRHENERIVPNPTFDGIRNRMRFNATNVPLLPGYLKIVVGNIELSDQGNGQLTSNDNSSGEVNYDSGEIKIQFAMPPALGAIAQATYASSSLEVLRDLDGAGGLRGRAGNKGKLGLKTGRLTVELMSTVKSGAKFSLKFAVSAVSKMSDPAGTGNLISNDGSTGSVDYEKGSLSLDFASPPPSGASLQAQYKKDVLQSSTMDLRTIVLDGANLSNANLSYTDLSFASLIGTNLAGANLTGAILVGAKLNNANLSGANLKNSDLNGANLSGTNLSGANLEGTIGLNGQSGGAPPWLAAGAVDCSQSTDPNCIEGSFSVSALVAAIASGSLDPSSGALEGAALMGANLSSLGDLSNAKLMGANLTGANLSGLKLVGADFSDAILKGAILDGIKAPDLVCMTTGRPCYDQGAQCPGGLPACISVEVSKLKLVRADMEKASLRRADIQGADLTDAIVKDMNSSDANLARAILEGSAGGVIAPGTILNPKALTRLDFSGSNLSGTNMSEAKLKEALMRNIKTSLGTRFTKAIMTKVDLENAVIYGANFAEAKLGGANLKNIKTDMQTDFSKADLTAAILDHSDLRGSKMTAATLMGASMRHIVVDEDTDMAGAVMMGVDLSHSCLTNSRVLNGQVLMGSVLAGVNLSGAQLNGANFTGVDLSGALLGNPDSGGARCRCRPEGGPSLCGSIKAIGANFTGANLSNAELSNADLRKVTLDGATLVGAKLSRTDLREASMKKVNFTGVDLRSAILTAGDFSEAELSGNLIADGKFISANFAQTNMNGTTFRRANMTGAVFDSVRSNRDTSMRLANMSVTAIVGCLHADLTGASFLNASLVRGAINASDFASDYNCRVNFENVLFRTGSTQLCANPFPSEMIKAGMDVTGIYTQATLVANLSNKKSHMDCAYLKGTDLKGLNLAGGSFRGASLSAVKLGRNAIGVATNLRAAKLEKADLSMAQLEWADLRDADMTGSNIEGASLKYSDLRGANLDQTRLNSATKFELAKYSCKGSNRSGCTRFPNFPGFRWRQLKMIGPQSELSSIDLSAFPGLSSPPVDLRAANLNGAKFIWTNLSTINFTGANMESANLSNAIVRGANFLKTNLKGTVFSGASISTSTNFSGANIIEANFVGSSGTPRVGGALCSEKTAFNSARLAYVLTLKVSIEGSFPLYFPVITIALLPGWNVAGQCCFPVKGGIRIGC
jgi:uncharacterized protein YjbI with pentapeptide repeats